MKILMICRNYSPIIENGRDRHVFELSNSLVKNGVEVHVVTPIGEERLTKESIPIFEFVNGVYVHRVMFNEVERPNYLRYTSSLIEAVITLSNKHNFDIIHCHDSEVANAGLTLKNVLKLPLLITVHFSFGKNSKEYPNLSKKEREILPECTHIITVSRVMEGELRELYDLDNISIIPNGINIDSINQHSEIKEDELKKYKNKKNILYVGRLAPEKGVEYLIRALQRIVEKYPETILFIVGKGKQRHYLEELCNVLGIQDNVKFLGFINNQDLLNKLYKLAQVMVIPSVYEPFGLVALEGMAAGVPVIVSKVGGLQEIPLHNESGIIIPPENKFAIVNAVEEVFTNNGFSEYLKKNAQERVKLFNWGHVAQLTIDTYKHILKH